jgi:single-strand DNA-binding protein
MASFNKVILMGNLTRDPEVRYIPSGTAVCELGLAVSEKFKNQAGDEVEQVCFVDIVVWGRQGETCGEYLSKGRQVMIEGRLQFDQWKSKEGESRSKLRVRADRVQFLGSPRSDAEIQDGGGDQASAGASGESINDEAEPANESAVDARPSGLEEDEDNLPF